MQVVRYPVHACRYHCMCLTAHLHDCDWQGASGHSCKPAPSQQHHHCSQSAAEQYFDCSVSQRTHVITDITAVITASSVPSLPCPCKQASNALLPCLPTADSALLLQISFASVSVPIYNRCVSPSLALSVKQRCACKLVQMTAAY